MIVKDFFKRLEDKGYTPFMIEALSKMYSDIAARLDEFSRLTGYVLFIDIDSDSDSDSD